MNKRTVKWALRLLMSFSAVAMSMSTFAFAWLSGATTEVNVETLEGGVISQYFHCGSGAESDPFVITRPVHMYNMTELYENLDGFAENNYYFQLGYDLDGDTDLEVYSYDDSGVYQDAYADSLNMAYYQDFTPIGSETKPFGGTFEGSNLTVDSLNISGSGISDIGFFGYVTTNASIKNLYINNITLDVSGAVVDAHDTHNTNAYVGYIAGHVEDATSFSNTYVNNSEITGQSVLTKNNWGYFGYCENAASLDEFIMKAKGENAGWGGSVDMKKMYNRLYDIAGQATTNAEYAFEKDVITNVNGTTTERATQTGYAYTYRTEKEGSFIFTQYDANSGPLSDFMYLHGGSRVTPYNQTETTKTGYTIYYNNHYLGVNGTAIADVESGWDISNNTISIAIDGTKYYLTHDLTLSATQIDEWTNNNGRIYWTTEQNYWIITITTYHYITYDNGWTISTTNRQNGATKLTLRTTTISSFNEQVSGSEYLDYSGENVTYFPLITNTDNYEAAGKNTGYVIGGCEDIPNAYPRKTGDIRVSRYGTGDISNSYSDGNFTTIYTINSNLRTEEIDASDYQKFADSRAELLETIGDGTDVYGLHFMSADISTSHLVTAEYALINGTTYNDYQMPASSIDFNVKEKGFINFFAGTYFSGNDSFFSLHHITRDGDNIITAINEISEIYGTSNDSDAYIYKYSDNSYSGTLTSDYSLLFSTERIKQQSRRITDDAVYYFEIPVNGGEFCLGSVDGGTGAYLMYLDIGTNGGTDTPQDVDTFGTIEYRSATDVIENSILLITYEQTANDTLSLLVQYVEAEKAYYITKAGTLVGITITLLNLDYKVYYNNTQLAFTDIQSLIV